MPSAFKLLIHVLFLITLHTWIVRTVHLLDFVLTDAPASSFKALRFILLKLLLCSGGFVGSVLHAKENSHSVVEEGLPCFVSLDRLSVLLSPRISYLLGNLEWLLLKHLLSKFCPLEYSFYVSTHRCYFPSCLCLLKDFQPVPSFLLP